MARHQPDRKQRTGIIAMSKEDREALEKGLALYHAQEALKAQRRLANAAEVNAGMRTPGSSNASNAFGWMIFLAVVGIGFWIYLDSASFIAFVEGFFQ